MRKLLDRYFKDLPREVAVITAVAFCVALGFGIVAPIIPVFAKSFEVSAFAAVQDVDSAVGGRVRRPRPLGRRDVAV